MKVLQMERGDLTISVCFSTRKPCMSNEECKRVVVRNAAQFTRFANAITPGIATYPTSLTSFIIAASFPPSSTFFARSSRGDWALHLAMVMTGVCSSPARNSLVEARGWGHHAASLVCH